MYLPASKFYPIIPVRGSSLEIPKQFIQQCFCVECVVLRLKIVDNMSVQRFQKITDWANSIFEKNNQNYTCTLKMTMFVCIELFAIHDYMMMNTNSTYLNTPYHLFKFKNYTDSEYFLLCIINYN
jgi:hypothetical protein